MDTNNINIGQLPGQQHYCRITIKGQEYFSKNIMSLIIREWVVDVLARIEIIMYDDGTLNEILPFEDNDIIKVTIGKHADDPDPLECEFILADYQMDVMADNRQMAVSISGYLKAKDMFIVKNRSFRNKNSRDILTMIANENRINFVNPNFVSPNDTMTWYQVWKNNYDFINHVLSRSNAINDLILFYSNSQNEFVYTSLNKEIEKIPFRIARYDVDKCGQNIVDESIERDVIYYNHYDVVNYSSLFNKINTYKIEYDYYDPNTGRSIVGNYNTSKKTTELRYKDSEFVNKLSLHRDCGTLNNKNIYNGYFQSLVQNDYLRNEFFSNSVVININALSKVKLFEKIHLSVPSMFSKDNINEVMSGDYWVGGIVHQVSHNGVYRKSLSLHRNGINKSVHMKQFRMS